ncbi:MAG: flagellar motor switch protein FliG [Treponema sp.]|jgi:flagellar motor switch protein FliG|nr:flagellar motor switch protein FliG [Treponema sp.]
MAVHLAWLYKTPEYPMIGIMAKVKPPEITPPGSRLPLRGLAAYQQALSQQQGPSLFFSSAKTEPRGETPPQVRAGEGAKQFIKTDGDALAHTLFQTKFRKTPQAAPQGEPTKPEPESKYRRVAKFLILVGADQAAKILSHLNPEQVEAIAQEIAAIRGITPEESEAILMEFRSLLAASYRYTGPAFGGLDTARQILHTAFGPEQGEAFLKQTHAEAASNPFVFLEDCSGEQVVFLFKDESPAVEALVLSRVSPSLAAAVLAHSPPDRKIALIRRIAHLEKTSPEVVDRVAAALKERIRHLDSNTGPGIDGIGALTAILKAADPSFGERIMEEFTRTDPYLSRDLKDRLHTLDDVVQAEDRAIEDKLFSMSDLDIVLLLKGRSQAFTEKIFANMSAERRAHIREEAKILGPVRRRDVDRVAKEFLDWFRENREAGRILLLDDKDILV